MTYNAKCSDEEFAAIWKRCRHSPAAVSKFLNCNLRSIYRRRSALEKRGIYLGTVRADDKPPNSEWSYQGHAYAPRVNETIKDGWLIVFSDAHYWPGQAPVAHEALLKIAAELKPKLVIANGDVFDGANISRHEPMGWQRLPTVMEELDVVKKRLGEIERATPKSKFLMTVGNHDSRFDRRLATETSQFEEVPGMRLSDHISWPMSYTVLINEGIDPVFVLHNIKGGIHAPYNNIKAAGCSVITGHLHSQKAQPYSTLLHDWEGIDAGCLADKDHPAFSYAMDRPKDWRSGFVAMKFDREGRRYPGEFCRVIWDKKGARAVWRSEVVVSR